MDKPIRSFIAIELEISTQNSLKTIQDHLKTTDADVKWVKPTNIHLTLRFLGNLHPKKLKILTKEFPDYFKRLSAFEADMTNLDAFPRLDKPRVLWIGIEKNAERIEALEDQLEEHLCKLGIPKEKEKFIPHLTIGRVRSNKNLSFLVEKMKDYSFEPISQVIKKIVLFKSSLTSSGPIYSHLSEAELQ